MSALLRGRHTTYRPTVVLIVVVRVQIRRVEVQVVAVRAIVLSRRPVVAVATHIVPTAGVEVAAVDEVQLQNTFVHTISKKLLLMLMSRSG